MIFLISPSLKELVPDSFGGILVIKETVCDAVSYACDTYEGVICITGSFYTVGEAMNTLEIKPYGNL